jgi:hypothetical protein
MSSPFSVILQLIRRILSRPAWLIVLFMLLVCLIPFTGGTSAFRSDPTKILDPFGFSLLTPSKHAFGPHEMMALAILLIVPSVLIDSRRSMSKCPGISCDALIPGWVIPATAASFYAFYVLLSLPLLARSSFFPGPISLLLAIVDLLILAASMALIVDFAMTHFLKSQLTPLIAWMTAGAFHMGISISDAYIVAPQLRELVEPSWTAPVWHALILIVAITLHSLPVPAANPRATL